MKQGESVQSSRQQLFREMVLGTLVYSVVLGFFNDYTDILSTWSYSTTFFVAIVLQILTHITFRIKDMVAGRFKGREGSRYKVALVVGVWLVIFLSKFVFLAVINFTFGTAVEISGFIGLMLIIITMTVAQKLIELVYESLA